MTRRVRQAAAVGLCAGLLLLGCASLTPRQAALDANARINRFCDERAALLDSLRGEAGAP